MIFKLKFQTSATTLLEPYEIIAKIQLELKDWKYNVKDVTGNTVSFKDNPWRLRWNFEPKMVDGGEFVISYNPDNEKLLRLNYYYNLFPALLALTIMSTILISDRVYDGILFFGVFYAVAVPIDIIRSRVSARELVAAILQANA